MDFYAVLAQVMELLQREGRVSYRALKRQFDLDNDYLEDLKAEIIKAKRLAVDEDGDVLVWTGGTALPVASGPATGPERTPRSYTPAHLTEKILQARWSLEGERKQVTVLFADLKASMELLADRDPEEARQLLDPVLERMMQAVHRYEGTVNQIMGDGIMALFGAPIAHEDHAVRACYAALALQAALRSYSEEVRRTHGLAVHFRVGLNSGEVVVRAIDNDLHMDYSAIGQTVHLAARMEQLAMPGSILLTPATLRLVEGYVEVNLLGPVPVKGLPEPIEIYELLRAGPVRTRLQAAAARGLTRFVVRNTELDQLRQALDRAGCGHGQVVAVIGEPGVGKSRLFWEFTQSHRTAGWLLLASHSVSYGKATAYLPVIDLLKAYCGVETRDEARSIREKVTGKLLTLDETLKPTLPAILALLDVPVEDTAWQALDPQQRRRHTLEAVRHLLLRESQVQPVLVVFEDLHWIDTETQAVLDLLVDSLPTARVLLLANYRPEYQHGWGSKTSYSQLRLDPLPTASAEELLQTLLGNDSSLESLRPRVIAQTQGNPFFLEESVRTLVETGVLVGERRAYRLEKPFDTLQIPATVQALLAARIDRLPPEDKRLLQTAAVIGTEVPWPLLHALADMSEDALSRSLAQLQAAEFLYETSLFPERAYTFKHALTHEVAYGSLLHERRRFLHARIVEALEVLAGDRLAEQVERLAHHALRGEVWDKALAYSRQAGEKAMTRSAYREAVGYVEQALSTLPHLPETRDAREQAIDLRLALRSALSPLGDLGRILACLREAEALAEALDDPRRLGQVSRFLSNYFSFIGEYDQAIAAAQRVLVFATAGGDGVLWGFANQYLGRAYHAQGAYQRAIECLGQAMASFDGPRRREHFGQVILPAVISRVWLAWCHAELGTFPKGSTLGAEGLRIAETVPHPASLMFAWWGIGLLALRQGDRHRALPRLERAVDICQDAELPYYFPLIAAPLVVAFTLGGPVAEAVPLLTQALKQTMAMERADLVVAFTLGGPVAEAVPLLTQALKQTMAMERADLQVFWRLHLGEAQLRAGRLEEAQALADQALALACERHERGHEASALCLLGDIAAQHKPSEVEPAEAYYQQALALAEELGMRPLLAHCHRGLGTLYATLGRSDTTRPTLAAAIALYRSMDMTFWLPQAEAALAQVEGR